ncbi:MAG: TSUP family transporter, partial [Pseudomonadota bacterium]
MNEPLALIDLLSVPGAILVITAFLAALLSTSIGAGGGLLLLGLANFMPASAVIPTHASVMLFGSLFGWNLLRESADHKVITPFVLGSIIGLGLAASFVGKLSHHTLSLILAGFLLITTWIRLPQSLTLSRHYSWQCGLVSSFLSVFVGATRPMLLTMFSKTFDDHKTVVATVNA